MFLSNPESAWHMLSWEEEDGAQRSQTPAKGWELGYTWLRGGVWDPLSPSSACAGNRMSTGIAAGLLWESSGLWQNPKSMGSCSASRWESPSKGETQGQVRRESCSPSHPVPHLPTLFLTLSSCSSSRPGSCPWCTVPAGLLSLPPP